jgi:hypothetical protein
LAIADRLWRALNRGLGDTPLRSGRADRTRASWQPYRNETQYLFTPPALKRISTIAFHLAASVKRNALSAGRSVSD